MTKKLGTGKDVTAQDEPISPSPAAKSQRKSQARSVRPKLMLKGFSRTISLHDFVSVMSMISDHDQLDALAAQARTAPEAKITVPAETANLVKTFVAKHEAMSAHPIGMKVTGDPADDCCSFEP